MRHRNYEVEPGTGMKWHVIKMLFPYLLEFKKRVLLALSCLVLAKIASIIIPFILKHIVDALDAKDLGSGALLIAPLGLVAAYGLARFMNVVFNEVRDTLFGRVTERTITRRDNRQTPGFWFRKANSYATHIFKGGKEWGENH